MRIICIAFQIYYILNIEIPYHVSCAALYLNSREMPYTSLTMQIASEYLTDRKGGFASGVAAAAWYFH